LFHSSGANDSFSHENPGSNPASDALQDFQGFLFSISFEICKKPLILGGNSAPALLKKSLLTFQVFADGDTN